MSMVLTYEQVPKLVLQALLQFPASTIRDRDWRISLLSGLDTSFIVSIPESTTPTTDLTNIVNAAWNYRDKDGRAGLIFLLDNAIDPMKDTQLGATLTDIRTLILTRLNDPGFIPTATPSPPGDQYVPAGCALELPPPGPVPPSPDDRGY